MDILANRYLGEGLVHGDMAEVPWPSVDAAAPRKLMALWASDAATPLISAAGLADVLGVADVLVKDERGRMGLGSFKALGAAYVIAHHAVETGTADLSSALSGRSYVTASAGNHGLSVAAGARAFGARAVIYLADTVPESFARRLRNMRAEVIRAGADYAASMAAAAQGAVENGWVLLSDSSWPGYYELPHRLMEGYLAMAAELVEQLAEAPTHILLQAGVGGLAGSCAALFRARWGDAVKIIVVEPEVAAALFDSIIAGHAVVSRGPVSAMGRLDCKEPSLIALKSLARDADLFTTISEAEAAQAMPVLDQAGLTTTPSGGAGLAALFCDGAASGFGLTAASRVLCILSEVAE